MVLTHKEWHWMQLKLHRLTALLLQKMFIWLRSWEVKWQKRQRRTGFVSRGLQIVLRYLL